MAIVCTQCDQRNDVIVQEQLSEDSLFVTHSRHLVRTGGVANAAICDVFILTDAIVLLQAAPSRNVRVNHHCLCCYAAHITPLLTGRRSSVTGGCSRYL